jgi:hypothetical protein
MCTRPESLGQSGHGRCTWPASQGPWLAPAPHALLDQQVLTLRTQPTAWTPVSDAYWARAQARTCGGFKCGWLSTAETPRLRGGGCGCRKGCNGRRPWMRFPVCRMPQSWYRILYQGFPVVARYLMMVWGGFSLLQLRERSRAEASSWCASGFKRAVQRKAVASGDWAPSDHRPVRVMHLEADLVPIAAGSRCMLWALTARAGSDAECCLVPRQID